MAGTDFSHLTNDELIKGIRASNLPDYIRSKAYGIDVRETLAQMTEMTIQLGVNMGLSPDDALLWARKLQETVSQSDFDSWVATLLDGGPSIFMNTLSELQTTYPNGAAGVALVRETDPAKIYVWNGSSWEDFGDYQGIEIKDGTVTTSKLSDGAVTHSKTTFLEVGKNLLDPTRVVTGSLQITGGVDGSFVNSVTSDFIPVNEGDIIYLYYHPNLILFEGDVYLFDVDKAFIKRIKSGTPIIGEGVEYARTSFSKTIFNNLAMVTKELVTEYHPFIVRTKGIKMSKEDIVGDLDAFKPLEGKIIVNLGDSIFGNTQGENSVSNRIAEKTGAHVYNVGFGGSRIAKHQEYWDAFSLYRLADEIIKPNSDNTKWALQDAAVTARKNGEVPGMPAYFDNHLALLKSIDFNDVWGLTISGGTNDSTANIMLDNEVDKYDTETFSGSYRYSLEKIITKYKHLNILVCTPIYRFWMDDQGDFLYDSDTKSFFDTPPLTAYVQKTIDIAREFKTPHVDNYYGLGINKHNRQLYFPLNDGTHPNAVGNKKLGYKIGSALISNF